MPKFIILVPLPSFNRFLRITESRGYNDYRGELVEDPSYATVLPKLDAGKYLVALRRRMDTGRAVPAPPPRSKWEDFYAWGMKYNRR